MRQGLGLAGPGLQGPCGACRGGGLGLVGSPGSDLCAGEAPSLFLLGGGSRGWKGTSLPSLSWVTLDSLLSSVLMASLEMSLCGK